MFYYRAYRYLWMIVITCMFEAQAHSDFFPEYCRNMYFHENYKDLIANPDKVKNGNVTINSTIINEANNSGTCYANAGINIFEGQICSPHPIVSALTYKTTLASNKDTLEGGYLDIFLNKINNLIEICDSKKLHDFYGAKFYVDLFLDKLPLNDSTISYESLESKLPSDWSTDLKQNFHKNFISILSDSTDLFMNRDLKIKRKVAEYMCFVADAWVDNPLYNKINYEEYLQSEGKDIDVTEIFTEKFLSAKEEKTFNGSSLYHVPHSSVDIISLKMKTLEPSVEVGEELHAYVVLGTRYQSVPAQCQIVLKDTNPYVTDDNCKDIPEDGIHKIFDKKNNACYIYASYHWLKPKISSYVSVNITN